MTVRIYLRRFGRVVRLYKLKRTKKGIYLFAGTAPRPKTYISYHDDGHWWSRFEGVKNLKMLRAPLSSFKGQETLSISVRSIYATMPWDLDEASQLGRSDDIVLDLDGRVGLEIALTDDSSLTLPALPGRSDSTIFVKEWTPPFLLVEGFKLEGNMFPIPRFPSLTARIEGENVFFDDTRRI